MTFLADAALSEFRHRKASIDAAVASGTFPRAKGEWALGCWLAIALAARVAVGELGAIYEFWADDVAEGSGLTGAALLVELHRRCPPPAQWRPELARARDQIAPRARANPTDQPLGLRHLHLEALAIHLGADPEPGADAGADVGSGQAEPERKAA